MSGYGDYIVVFVIAAVATWLLTFPVRALAIATGAVDQPRELRIHDRPLPVIGGAGMFVAFAVTFLVASLVPGLQHLFRGTLEPTGIVLAGLVVYLVGLIDDVREISAPAKVAGQVLAAMVLVALGVTMYYFKLPFLAPIITLSPSVIPLITAAWVVGMTNAVNLIDGLDGLAAGIVAIGSGSLCVYGLRLVHLGDLPSDDIGPLVAAVTAGVAVGFLPHNFHPSKIIMGDGGALFLGLQMAAATMVIGGRTAGNANGVDVSGLTFFRFAPLFLPFVILGVPMLDTVFAVIRRTARRASFAERDLGHLHHRLIRLGHGHRRAVLILWAWTALLCAFVLLPVFYDSANAYVPIGVGVLGVALYTVFRPAGRSAPSDPEADATPLGEEPASGAVSSVPVVVSGSIGRASAGEPDRSTALPKDRRVHSARAPRRRFGSHTRSSHPPRDISDELGEELEG